MAFRHLFQRLGVRAEEAPTSVGGLARGLSEPADVVAVHRTRLTALRLESGYSAEQFERLIGSVVYHVAEYAHVLPASRAENHAEAGGLLRLAVESACLAFRRTDGQFLAGPASTDVRNRERDRLWRYTAFLGGLLRPLGRCATHVKVTAAGRGDVWNPYQEPLWVWMRRIDAMRLELHWRDQADGRPVQPAAIWMASRVLSPFVTAYLQSTDDALPELLLRVLAGERTGRVCEAVDEAYQAAIELDLSQRGTNRDSSVAPVRLEYRLLEALRILVREKWTLNCPGGRLWVTKAGVFLVWKPAVNDLLIRLRAEGVTGAPREPDTIAELLRAHGVLADNPESSGALKHTFRLIPQLKGVPKQAIDVVKIADADLLGLRTDGVEAIDAELVNLDGARNTGASTAAPVALELALNVSPGEEAAEVSRNGAANAGTHEFTKTASEIAATPRVDDVSLSQLQRFGEAGRILRGLAERVAAEPGFAGVVALEEGLAIAYPEAIVPFCERPQEFLTLCQAQGLLVPDRARGQRVVHKRAVGVISLPEQYVVLSPRAAKYIKLAAQR